MSNRLRTIIIEDSDDDATLLQRELRSAGYELTSLVIDTSDGLRTALRSQEWNLILSDNSMPQFSAAAALGILRESGLDIPFIVVSGAIGEEVAVELMRMGAHDFVMKDKPGRLMPAIERELREAEVRRERLKSMREEQRLSKQIQEEHQKLEQRVTELSALNNLFQKHLVETLEIETAYRELVEGLSMVSAQVDELWKIADAHPLREPDEILLQIRGRSSMQEG